MWLHSFHCFNSFHEEKNSRTAAVTSTQTIAQFPPKNSALNPSGPGVLFMGRENNAFLTSKAEKGAKRLKRSASEHLYFTKEPRVLTEAVEGELWLPKSDL